MLCSVSDWCLWSRRAACLDCPHLLLPKTEVKLSLSRNFLCQFCAGWCFVVQVKPKPWRAAFSWEARHSSSCSAMDESFQKLLMNVIKDFQCLLYACFFLLSLFFCVETWVGQAVKHYQISGEQIFRVFWCVTIFFFFFLESGRRVVEHLNALSPLEGNGVSTLSKVTAQQKQLSLLNEIQISMLSFVRTSPGTWLWHKGCYCNTPC